MNGSEGIRLSAAIDRAMSQKIASPCVSAAWTALPEISPAASIRADSLEIARVPMQDLASPHGLTPDQIN